MAIQDNIDALTASTTNLLNAVTVQKSTLDTAVTSASTSATNAATSATTATTQATSASTSATNAATSATTATTQATAASTSATNITTTVGPFLSTSRRLLDLVPQSYWSDMTSGSPAMDHTAVVAAALADSSLNGTLLFPSNGVLNVDRMHVPLACPAKNLILDNCTVQQRSAWTSGLGHFFRLTPSGVTTYGSVDDFRIEGGIIQQTAYMAGAVFMASLTRRLRINGTKVYHRTIVPVAVTLNTGTGTFTAAAHGFVNGDVVTLFAGTTAPTGSPASGTPMYIIGATTNTFQLSLVSGGSAITFSDTGAGTLYVCYFGSWGFQVGGQNMRIAQTGVLNGAVVFQDGHHITHGNDIELSGCHSYSGDDAYAFGTEVGDFDNLSNVSVDGCYARSQMASALKIYVNDSTRTVNSIHVNGLKGAGGLQRNGAISIVDSTGTDPRSAPAKIETVRVMDCDLTSGSATRTQTVNPYHIKILGAADIEIQGRFYSDTYAIQEYNLAYADRVRLTMGLRTSTIPNVVPGVISSTARNVTVVEHALKNLVQSPQAEGAIAGTPGMVWSIRRTG